MTVEVSETETECNIYKQTKIRWKIQNTARVFWVQQEDINERF